MTWLFVMTKSGAVFAFDTKMVNRLTSEDGYFVADGLCSLGGHNAFRQAKKITIHHNEISCYWYEDRVL